MNPGGPCGEKKPSLAVAAPGTRCQRPGRGAQEHVSPGQEARPTGGIAVARMSRAVANHRRVRKSAWTSYTAFTVSALASSAPATRASS